MSETFNVLTYLAAVIVYIGIGALWYSPKVFFKPWAKEVKISMDSINKTMQQQAMMGSVIAAFITGWVLWVFITKLGVQTPIYGAFVGFMIGVGFITMAIATNFLYENKSPKLLAITAGHHIVAITIMGAILGI